MLHREEATPHRDEVVTLHNEEDTAVDIEQGAASQFARPAALPRLTLH